VSGASGIKDTGNVFVGANYNNNTTPMTIPQICVLLDRTPITEGDVLNCHAMIFNVFTVSYEDKFGITLATDNVLCSINDTSSPYTITQTYNATDEYHHFEGWNVLQGSSNIANPKLNGTAVSEPYPQNTTMNISGDVRMSTEISEGNWLVFDENGKNATYNAPVFVKKGQTAASVRPDKTLPANMERLGYTFAGWYLSDPAPANTGDDPNGAEFNFNQELTDRTVVYAKWTIAPSATYTVVVWKQKTTGGTTVNDYDFSEARTFTGTPKTNVNTVSQTGSNVTDANGTYQNAVVSGWKEFGGEEYMGFHCDRFDQNVEIQPNGTTVVNIYYNRNMVQLRFNVFTATNGYTQDNGSYEEGVEYYGRSGNYNYTYFRIYRYNNNWIYENNGSYYYYNGNRYVKNGSWSEQTSLRMNGLYGSTLAENNDTWPTTYDWHAVGHRGGGVSGVRTTFLDAFIPASTSMIVDYYGYTPSGSYYVYFYQQNAEGTGYTLMNSVLAGNENGINFNLSDKYTGFKCAQWSDDGTNWHDVGELMTVEGDLYYDAHPETNGYQYITSSGNVYIRFDRLSYKIKYSDGSYFDKQGRIDETPQAQGFGESDPITYGASIAAYGDPESDVYNTPSVTGYYFMGWYADSTCNVPYNFNTMPLGGVQVYARWQKIEYRVFLHPQAGHQADNTADITLDWGSATQQMNFKVDYDAKISLPTGRRTGYEFLGWYLDEGGNNAYTVDTKLNDSTVPADPAYDKTLYMTENADGTDMDKWGDLKPGAVNKDTTRPYVYRMLNLYAKWSEILPGASGVGVVYDPNGGNPAPQDLHLYKDNIDAVAQAAPSQVPPPRVDENGVEHVQHFLYWVVQYWDASEGKFKDLEGEEYIKYPGETFRIHASYARVEPILDDQGQYVYDITGQQQFRYTISLRAVWGDVDGPAPTHITWHANNGTGDVMDSDDVAINETIQIPMPQAEISREESVYIPWASSLTDPQDLIYEDHVFLGWARVEETPNMPQDLELGEDDLFLKYDPENKCFLALVDESEEQPTEEKQYYLVGNFNGADYDGTDYAFHNGMLVVTFQQDSYVAVMPEGASGIGDWYFTNGWLGFDTTTATLATNYGSNANKLFVPKDTILTFMLTENSDGTLTLKVTKGIVAGTSGAVMAPVTRDGEGQGESEPQWVTVKYVAADEFSPYHTLYAVWGKVFYIYHTGDNTVERIVISGSGASTSSTQGGANAANTAFTIDLASRTTEGFLYGGYYSAYSGVGLAVEGSADQFDKNNANIAWVEPTDSADPYGDAQVTALVEKGYYSSAVDTTGTPYGGTSKNTDGSTVPVFALANAYTTEKGGADGMHVVPEAGAVYYIKEVPASKYLQPYFHFTYLKETDPANQALRSAWLISDIDDALYQETGFVIQTADKTAYVCSTLTVENAVGGAQVTLKPENIFRGKGVTGGYLSYLEVMNNGACSNGMGTGVTIGQYWVTPDGLIVTGTSTRTYSDLSTKTSAKNGVQTQSVASTIAVFEATTTNP
jgi:uncharacterized repeat protein (TIGR02543 family)